jgi:hypothetical protein
MRAHKILFVTLLVALQASLLPMQAAHAVSPYRLPWAGGTTWNVTQGQDATRAFDFQPPGSGSNNDQVMAVAAGQARIVCTDNVGQATVTLDVNGSVFRDLHLQTSAVLAAGLTTSNVGVRQGQVLGRLHPNPPGSAAEHCGYATPAGASHLHLEMPSLPISFVEVTFPVAAGARLTSQNVACCGPPSGVAFQPFAADFNGEGKADIGMRNVDNGIFFIKHGPSFGDQVSYQWAAG